MTLQREILTHQAFLTSAIFAALALLVACAAPHVSSTEAQDTTPSTVTRKGPPLLSAFFGLDHALPGEADWICEGADGKNGMPVVFPRELALDTLQAGDFRIKTKSGKMRSAFCVTPQPALDPGESRTILLIGDYGDEQDPPTQLYITGNLLDRSRTQNFKGRSIKVIRLEAGPTLVLAQTVQKAEWSKKNSRATICPENTLQVVRATWAGGVTRADGKAVGEVERQAYRVTLRRADGTQTVVTPFALADLNDNDNNHDLCLDVAGKAIVVPDNTRWLVHHRRMVKHSLIAA